MSVLPTPSGVPPPQKYFSGQFFPAAREIGGRMGGRDARARPAIVILPPAFVCSRTPGWSTSIRMVEGAAPGRPPSWDRRQDAPRCLSGGRWCGRAAGSARRTASVWAGLWVNGQCQAKAARNQWKWEDAASAAHHSRRGRKIVGSALAGNGS
jgi:hypothetical protein